MTPKMMGTLNRSLRRRAAGNGVRIYIPKSALAAGRMLVPEPFGIERIRRADNNNEHGQRDQSGYDGLHGCLLQVTQATPMLPVIDGAGR
jgi:hypothetical protein